MLLPLEEKMGLVMKHAGVAISITTFTDLVAFTIASFSTKIFFMRNFCYFAILSLSFVYLYICTFFLAALAVDQKRIDAGRDACCCCLKPERPDQPFGGCTIPPRPQWATLSSCFTHL